MYGQIDEINVAFLMTITHFFIFEFEPIIFAKFILRVIGSLKNIYGYLKVYLSKIFLTQNTYLRLEATMA